MVLLEKCNAFVLSELPVLGELTNTAPSLIVRGKVLRLRIATDFIPRWISQQIRRKAMNNIDLGKMHRFKLETF